MISTLLVANRGEIACRVFRTCREQGIATVAVYADPDADALHVRAADTAVRLPGAAPAGTYLRGDLIVRAALAAGADAVHPGYGFLSENAEFARAVLAAGLRWIGPPPEAIEAMASKTRAKELMAAAGVPLLAPVDPATATPDQLPLLLKASAGGGGRGMRVVRELDAMEAELRAASAEARAAFGDGEVFAEPYVTGGRHVEVQVLADAHGTVWALGTRDCSLQRRHQKVIEECPAPGLPDALRTGLAEAAVAAARAVGYRGAGTVEFLVTAEGRPYFLEMNTRLQVEHPVTEEVFGLDLVALQLSVAEGDPLPPEPPPPYGHAVEARLYAEDPAEGWAPGTGRLHALSVPGAEAPYGAETSYGAELPYGAEPPYRARESHRSGTPRIRVDAGYAGGDTIGVHYDPLLAKVIAWAPTRAAALRRLRDTLRRARVHAPVSNRQLLVRSLAHPEVVAGRLDTGFYDRHLPALTAPEDGPEGGPGERCAAVAAALADAATRGRGGTVPARIGGWRNVPSAPQTKTYGTHEIRYRATRTGYVLEPETPEAPEAPETPEASETPETPEPSGPPIRVVAVTPGRVVLEVGAVLWNFHVTAYGDEVHVDSAAGSWRLPARPRFPEPRPATEPGSLLAPLPGTVVRVADGLAEGARVTAGQPVVWLEAMKMEHRVLAPATGTLTALHAAPGRQVEVGALLAVVTATDATSSTDVPDVPDAPDAPDAPEDT
ncbi:biotin carboxylase N-terminal domain-containing protein [Streptomyces sp. NPDC093085]|uniref:ATP-binding protein n=1 Tax=Streptomyces sp. NPDC093085 TaxID=3155068 RepID=UPI0034455D16